MFGISFGEIFIILMIAVFLFKPEDMKIIFKYFKKLILFINDIKLGINKEFLKIDDENFQYNDEEIKRINSYVEEIIRIEGKYEGDYSHEAIKKYHSICKQKVVERVKRNKSLLRKDKLVNHQ